MVAVHTMSYLGKGDLRAWVSVQNQDINNRENITNHHQQDDLNPPPSSLNYLTPLTFSAAGLVPVLPAHWLRRLLLPFPGWWALQETGGRAPPQDLVQPGASPLGGVTAGERRGEGGSKADPLFKNCLVTKLTTILKLQETLRGCCRFVTQIGAM